MLFKITGMDCAEEIALLKREVGPLVGGEHNLRFDLLNGRMTVLGGSVPIAAIAQTVARTGMHTQLLEASTKQEAPEESSQRRWQAGLMIVSGVLVAVGFTLQVWWSQVTAEQAHAFAHPSGTAMPWSALLVYLAAIAAGGRYIAPKALLAARRLRPDMNLLMTVAVIGAAAIGEWLEAGVSRSWGRGSSA